jgi:HlyD family secretion protein
MHANVLAISFVPLQMRSFLTLASLLAVTLVGCSQGKSAQTRNFETSAVQRQDLEIVVSATGVLQPVRVVEVKSKASGEIVALPVETGDYVTAGSILARLYPRDAQNQYEQARADVEAARARLASADSEFRRAESLKNAQLLPESDWESKRLEVVNARAQLVRAQTNMEIAAERLRETTVIAPVSGRIIEKGVELGSVVSSAVSQVSGGTTLMKMADLREVEIRALVDETDIGKVQAGQEARIRVDAYPGQAFRGKIQKIEPQAIVEQNVTMFPVLIRIPNEQEILRPGMNSEVDIFISRYSDVLSIPNEAIKTPRDAMASAASVGLTAEQVTAALGSEERGRGGEGARGRGQESGTAESSRTGSRRNSQSGSGSGSGSRPLSPSPPRPLGQGGGTGVVFKLVGDEVVPTRVTLGVSNWDHTQVVSGLKEGDTVIILPSASLLRQQEEFRNRMRGVSGVPGMGGGGGGRPPR